MDTLIKTLKDPKTGNNVLPRTRSRAITMEDGMNLDDKLVELDRRLTSLSAALDERTVETCIVNISVQNGASLAGQKITLSNITNSSKSETHTVQSGESSHTFKVMAGQIYKILVDAKSPYVTPAESSRFTAIAGNSRTVTMQYISTATFNVVITGNNKSGITVTATKGSKVVSGVTNSSGICLFTTDELGIYSITYSKDMSSVVNSVNVSTYTSYAISGQTNDEFPIYNLGDEKISITGGYSVNVNQTAGVGILTRQFDNLYLSSPQQDSSMIWVSTAKPIDVTNFTKMKVDYSIPSSYSEAFGLSATNNTRNSFVASKTNDSSVKTRQILELDITSVIGLKYPILYTAGSTAYGSSQMHVYKIWFE